MLALAATACSDGGGPPVCGTSGISNCPIPRIDFQPAPVANKIELSDAGLSAGDHKPTTIRIINTGFATLTVSNIRIDYTAPDGAHDGATPPFQIGPLPVELPTNVEVFGGTTFPQGLQFDVIYTKQDDALPRTANLVVNSNDPLSKEVTIALTTSVGAPALSATPNPLRFKIVPAGTTDEATVTLLNQGTRTLHVGGFKIANDARFGVKGDGFDIHGPDGLLGVNLTQAIEVPAGESKTVTVTFTSDSPSPANGQLIVYSDDPVSGANGYVINLEANKDGPCINVNPKKIEFGGKSVGSIATISFDIQSCGTEPLEVRDIAFVAPSSPDFSLDFTRLGAGFENGPSGSLPLVIEVGGKATVDVIFVPDTVNPRDADNVPIPDEGTIAITSNAYLSKVDVPVRGAGAESECPTPVIVVQEGEEVIPQTVIHLDGRQSYAPFGAIEAWEWTVKSWPEGTPKPTMIPNFTDPQPVVELNIVGSYEFCLSVRDENSNRSGTAQCPDDCYTVLVQPDQAIHIELTWHTPGDVDETDTGDGNGADLDLHFAHQDALGPDLDGDGIKDPWFDKDWDVFWYNRAPTWGNFDPNAGDDPTLDRDDTDGVGPENLNLSVPEDGVTYKIGAHYWNDWGFGPSDATVKVYHYADLVYTATYLDMHELDMWCVGEIHWPTVGVTRCAADGDPEKVTPNYINPFFRPPLFR
ncbi:MAG: choice-of-anchor D domain-containing protein [Myxococcota bacterium]